MNNISIILLVMLIIIAIYFTIKQLYNYMHNHFNNEKSKFERMYPTMCFTCAYYRHIKRIAPYHDPCRERNLKITALGR